VERGGRYRFVEQSGDQTNVFEGRVREVVPNERLVQTLEWDRMPGHVMVETIKLTDYIGGRTKVVSTTLFHTAAERWGMSTMEDGIVESFDHLEQLLVAMS
jgi:uncharacterized protein YndB with AHSA1/START domain